MTRRARTTVLAGLTAALATVAAMTAWSAPRPVLTAPVDASRWVELEGSVHPLATAANDTGPVPAALPLNKLQFILRRGAAQDAALTQLIADQQNRDSPRFHRWLTPAQFGVEFGANEADIKLAAAWLEAQGFTVGRTPAGRGRLPFAGTAAQVQVAFHTAVHYFNVDGKQHFANVVKPQIPAALTPLIIGIRGLHDFHPKPQLRARPAVPQPGVLRGGEQLVGPADFATIYNLTPLYANQILGTGVAIAIASQSDIDTTTPPAYWSAFGVTTAHSVSYLVPNSDPGTNSSENETDLDVEIANGLAPNAQIIVVSDEDAVVAAAYAIDQNLAAVLSISYGTCESQLGTASNAELKSDFQQAATQGITVVVSTGDEGSAACDSSSSAVYGAAVNGIASTAYAVAVGGTDFNNQLVDSGNYWSNSNAAGTLETALSYIPEMVWNDSCTNPVYIAIFTPGDTNPIDFCNNGNYLDFVNISSGGGGLSSASLPSGASYQGYAQPAWQTGVAGVKAFGARALPDVSLQASSWAVCTGASSSCDPASGSVRALGGTSAAAPAFAAIMALLDQTQISGQSTDGRQGLINPLLYELAATEYGSASSPNNANLSACNSSQGAAVGSSCIFYDITVGNNSVPCEVSNYVGAPAGTTPVASCTTSGSDTYGVLEINSTLSYTTTAGYDLATGLGALNAENFVNGAAGAPTELSATLQSGTATLSWSANPLATSGSTYDVYEGTAPSAEGTTPIQTGLTQLTTTVTGLTAVGQTYYFRVATVNGAKVSLQSNEASVANAPAAPTGVTATPSGTGFTVSWNASFGANSYSVYIGTSTGAETAAPNPSGITTTSQSYSSAGGSTYYLKVVALNVGGVSPSSAEATVTVVPAAPAGVYAIPSTNGVTLNWLGSRNASSYSVFEGTTPGGESGTAVLTGVTGTSATLTGLSAGQNYYFTVKAIGTTGTSAASGEAATETAFTAPTPTTSSNYFETLATEEGNLTAATVTTQTPIPSGVARVAPRTARRDETAADPAVANSGGAAAPANSGGGAIGGLDLFGLAALLAIGRLRRRRL